MLPCASSPAALRATTMELFTVAPQSEGVPTVWLCTPFVISGGRFWRTLSTCSPGAGTVLPHTPMCAAPSVSMTKLTLPSRSGATTWPFILKPPLKAASRKGASSAAMAGPRSWAMVARSTGGSLLPMWRSNTTRPASNRNSVTTRPDGTVIVRSSTAVPLTSVLTTVHPTVDGAASAGVVEVVGADVVLVVIGLLVVVGGCALGAGAGDPHAARSTTPHTIDATAHRRRAGRGRSRPA